MPEGTIIVVPGPGYVSDVLIGVLEGKPSLSSDIESYPGETMAVRKVKWVGRKQRAAFKPELREKLGNSHSVMKLDSEMRLQILEAGFDRFVFNGQFHARLETTESEFSTLDDYNIQSFINYVAGVMAAREHGSFQDHSVDMAVALAQLKTHPDLIPELSLNINSPGFLRFFSDRISPLVIAVLLSAALAVPVGAAPVAIQVTNSAALANDPCGISVAAEAMGAMKLMAYEEWHRACEQARDASANTGVKTNMHTKVHHQGPKP